jgi:phospholipase C
MPRRAILALGLAVLATLAAAAAAHAAVVHPSPLHGRLAASRRSPIRHVVILFQENHSFDNVLGRMCVRERRCDGTMHGRIKSGRVIRLRRATDIVPNVTHSVASQRAAIDHGRMDGFSTFHDCNASTRYRCYQQYTAPQIPNLAKLAHRYAISDRTFELDATPSFGSHIDLVTTTMDGFTGLSPKVVPGNPLGRDGWGCDSFRDTLWQSSPTARPIWVPACVPKPDGSGPYRRSPVDFVPTIMDRLQAAGRTWKLYTPTPHEGFYGFAICPTFADCIFSPQARHMVPAASVINDARAGRLPNFAIVTPTSQNSQHNTYSMRRGDNWIGSVVSAIQHGPQWRTTAIFITYDDCGCFYDHVAPPAGYGIREPMVIVSPWVKRGYTDSRVASFASLLAFAERTFKLKPLSRRDKRAYAYRSSFRYRRRLTARDLRPLSLHVHPLPRAEARRLAKHPPDDDPT